MSLLLVTPFSTYPFIQMDEIPASNLTIIYNTVKRLIWIMGIAWIIFASATFDNKSKSTKLSTDTDTIQFSYYQGYVSKFLSAKIWQPFSRLTFSIYLVQSLVVWYHGYQTRHLYPIDHYNAVKIDIERWEKGVHCYTTSINLSPSSIPSYNRCHTCADIFRDLVDSCSGWGAQPCFRCCSASFCTSYLKPLLSTYAN